VFCRKLVSLSLPGHPGWSSPLTFSLGYWNGTKLFIRPSDCRWGIVKIHFYMIRPIRAGQDVEDGQNNMFLSGHDWHFCSREHGIGSWCLFYCYFRQKKLHKDFSSTEAFLLWRGGRLIPYKNRIIFRIVHNFPRTLDCCCLRGEQERDWKLKYESVRRDKEESVKE